MKTKKNFHPHIFLILLSNFSFHSLFATTTVIYDTVAAGRAAFDKAVKDAGLTLKTDLLSNLTATGTIITRPDYTIDAGYNSPTFKSSTEMKAPSLEGGETGQGIDLAFSFKSGSNFSVTFRNTTGSPWRAFGVEVLDFGAGHNFAGGSLSLYCKSISGNIINQQGSWMKQIADAKENPTPQHTYCFLGIITDQASDGFNNIDFSPYYSELVKLESVQPVTVGGVIRYAYQPGPDNPSQSSWGSEFSKAQKAALDQGKRRSQFWTDSQLTGDAKNEAGQQALGMSFMRGAWHEDPLMTVLESTSEGMEAHPREDTKDHFRSPLMASQNLDQTFSPRKIQAGFCPLNTFGDKTLSLWVKPMGAMKKDDWVTGHFEGMLAGIDLKSSKGVAMGAFGGYGFQEAKLHHHLGKKAANSAYVGLYGNYGQFAEKGWSVQKVAVLSFDSYRLTRKMPALGDLKAKAKPSGISFAALSRVGYDFLMPHSFAFKGLEPFVAVKYAFINQKAYEEQGTDLFDLAMGRQKNSFLREEAGIAAHQQFATRFGPLSGSMQISCIVRHSLKKHKEIPTSFVLDPSPFTLTQRLPTTVYGGLLLSGEIQLPKRWAFQTLAKGEFTHREWQAKLMLDLRKAF